jgi:hypothetical protein
VKGYGTLDHTTVGCCSRLARDCLVDLGKVNLAGQRLAGLGSLGSQGPAAIEHRLGKIGFHLESLDGPFLGSLGSSQLAGQEVVIAAYLA